MRPPSWPGILCAILTAAALATARMAQARARAWRLAALVGWGLSLALLAALLLALC
jgi:hypothetical protein